MGAIEEKIKEEIQNEIYSDVSKIYDFIDTRYELSDEEKVVVIESLNTLNSNLHKALKGAKLK
jgi:uncharacterized protein YfkK (UPF0435 family)